MPPEEPGKVVALDLSFHNDTLFANGEMVMPSDENLRVSWYAQNVPDNYAAICGGVAYAYQPSIRHTQSLKDMRPTIIGGRCFWREPVRKDGLMFILILPESKTIVNPIPIPVESKPFNERISLFWLVWPEPEKSSETIEFQWDLRDLQNNIDYEVEALNKLISKSKNRPKNPEYDVALSFAGEDREYVDKVASALKQRKIKVFYDKFETVNLWGKNLYDHLNEVYANKSKYTVMFISENYKAKAWTNFERESAQERAFTDNREYILPIRFDNTEIPGMLKTTAYISVKDYNPQELAELIIQKLES